MTDESNQDAFVRDYLGRCLLARGRGLFDYLALMPQKERDEAVECVCSFGSGALNELSALLKSRPEFMHRAIELRPGLGKLIDEIAVVAKRSLTREDAAIFGMSMEIIREANEEGTGGRGLTNWTEPLSLAGDAPGEPRKTGKTDTFSPLSEGSYPKVGMVVIAPDDATSEEIRKVLEDDLGIVPEEIIRSED